MLRKAYISLRTIFGLLLPTPSVSVCINMIVNMVNGKIFLGLLLITASLMDFFYVMGEWRTQHLDVLSPGWVIGLVSTLALGVIMIRHGFGKGQKSGSRRMK